MPLSQPLKEKVEDPDRCKSMPGWEIIYSTPTINDQHIEQPSVHHGNTQPSDTTFEDL
jgi:hypothetical protein